ncbi:MAG: hypothetical protein LC122_14150 [Chitinophagales bacterium]|nr:hypothetical protein [Chitinophagales bacterium]
MIKSICKLETETRYKIGYNNKTYLIYEIICDEDFLHQYYFVDTDDYVSFGFDINGNIIRINKPPTVDYIEVAKIYSAKFRLLKDLE